MKHTDCGIDPPLMMDQKHLSSTYIIFSFGMLSNPFLYVPLVTSPKSQKQRKNVTSIIPLVILFQKFASIVTSLHRRLVNTEVIYIQQRCYCCSTPAIPGIQGATAYNFSSFQLPSTIPPESELGCILWLETKENTCIALTNDL